MGNSHTLSESRALQHGFKQIDNLDGSNGRYFVKNDLKWIHNIDALKRKLSLKYGRDITDHDLRDEGYDVDAYYQYNQ